MPTFDIKELLDSLAPDCLDLLEKASRFCLQQQHKEVTIAHFLLQMLAEKTYPLYRLIEDAPQDPIKLIKDLLQKTDRLRLNEPCKPVFSGQLLDWFANSRKDLTSSGRKTVGTKELLMNLVNAPNRYNLDLAALKALTRRSVESFFHTSSEEAETIPNETNLQQMTPDGTLLISDEAVLDVQKQAPGGLQINGYGELREIGAGGMARVYQARHLGLDRDVALKVLNTGTDSEFVARFMREARIVAQLTHPNIIQIYDVNQVQGLTYLAMEFISGGELSDRIDKGFKLNVTIGILTQVLDALQSAHDKGFIHRDIKPANILFRNDHSVVLTDFGIARAMGEDTGLTIAGSILGTPRYMSPEQARGDALDHRSDLYSVGVLFYQMIEGNLPYEGDSAIGTAMKHILDPIPSLSPGNADFQFLIDRAMAKQAGQRFQSAREMAEALQQLA